MSGGNVGKSLACMIFSMFCFLTLARLGVGVHGSLYMALPPPRVQFNCLCANIILSMIVMVVANEEATVEQVAEVRGAEPV